MSSVKYSADSQLIPERERKRLHVTNTIKAPWHQAETSFWAVLAFYGKSQYKTWTETNYIRALVEKDMEERLKSWHEELGLQAWKYLLEKYLLNRRKKAYQVPKNFSVIWREELRIHNLPLFLEI